MSQKKKPTKTKKNKKSNKKKQTKNQQASKPKYTKQTKLVLVKLYYGSKHK